MEQVPRQRYPDEHAGEVSRRMQNMVSTMVGNRDPAKRAARRIHRPTYIHSRIGTTGEEKKSENNASNDGTQSPDEPSIKRVILRQDSASEEPASCAGGGRWKWILASIISLLVVGLIVYACTRCGKRS
jgi:hypothetical protein